MFKRTRAVPLMVGLGLAASLAACGGSSSGPTSTPTPAPTPTPCTQSTVVQSGGSIPTRTLLYDEFTVSQGGRLDVTLDWTSPASPMGLYVVPAGTCTLDEFNGRTCNFLIRSEVTTKPRKVSTNVSAGNYRWLIGNFADVDESVSMQIVLSNGGCAPLSGAPGASERTEDGWPPIEHVRHR